MNIYERTNHSVNRTNIEECVVLFFAASHAVKDAGALLFPQYAKIAPFLVDQLQDHFLGGLDDNGSFRHSDEQWRA